MNGVFYKEGMLINKDAGIIEDNLPADLAEQHDHYLYGVAKK